MSRSSRQPTFTRREILALLGSAAGTVALAGCSREQMPLAPEEQVKPAIPGSVHYLSLTEVASLIENGELSPVELAEHMLQRIEALDGSLHSFATVTAERALSAAKRAEKDVMAGNYRGPLHGIPIAVKDLCYTQGTRTMGGMAVYRNFVPEFDATVVHRLEAAGAVMLGKLNLTEGAMAGYHPDFPIPVNPWGENLWPGASSSGSGVATASGLCFASLGTDTGGSIRFPSMANGIVGLKPTYGRVSRHGVLPLAESMDHVGPMARRTADAAIMLQAMAGFDQNDPTSLHEPIPDLLAGIDTAIDGLRIGYDPAFAGAGTDSGLLLAIEKALRVLETLGAQLVEVRMPAETAHLGDAWFALCSREAYQAHKQSFDSHPEQFGPFFGDFVTIGAAVTDEQHAGADTLRASFNRSFNELLGNVDAMVCPSGGVTFGLDPASQYGGREELEPLFAEVQMQFTIPADFAGTPTLTVPCGVSGAGVPYAMQFMGRRLSEATLCRMGHAYEQVTSWHHVHPPIA